MKGRLVVFEGTDGSGKSTQFDWVIDWLTKSGVEFKRLRFPRYDKDSSALVRMYLNGELGTHPDDVNAYAASTFYAVDRYASFVQDWRDYYNNGGLVLTDRYTTSNAVHQGGKVPKIQQYRFLSWLSELEYERMGLPEPNLVILLDMPTDLAVQLLKNREINGGEKRDIHEVDEEYLRHCHDTALRAAEFYGWEIVPCSYDGKLRSRESIQTDVRRIISQKVLG